MDGVALNLLPPTSSKARGWPTSNGNLSAVEQKNWLVVLVLVLALPLALALALVLILVLVLEL
jgi:hypothetical protein